MSDQSSAAQMSGSGCKFSDNATFVALIVSITLLVLLRAL
jgi:hypothetical protein